jgi:hypothetical protein
MAEDVKASADAIKGLGKAFHDAETNDIEPAITGLNNITVQAGDFKDGQDLAKLVVDRIGEVQKSLGTLKGVVGTIGDDLITVGNNYSKTEDTNTESVNKLTKDIDGALPGLNDMPKG